MLLKLNRWTILLIVLVLAAVVGIGVRQIASGPIGSQVNVDEGFSMSCPYLVRVDAGVPFEFECHVFNGSRFQDDVEVVSYTATSFVMDSVDNRYVMRIQEETLFPDTRYVGADINPLPTYSGSRAGTDRVRSSFESLYRTDELASVSAGVQIRLNYNVLLHMGPGLLNLQILATLAGTLLYFLASARGFLMDSVFLRRAYLAVDVFYLSFLLQALLMAIFFFVFTLSRAGYPNLDNDHWVSFLIGLGWFVFFGWLVYFARWRFFQRIVPREWRRMPAVDIDRADSGNWEPSTGPIVVAFVIGWFVCLFALPINVFWFGWFGVW